MHHGDDAARRRRWGAALAADSLDRSLPEALAAQLPGAAATIAARQAVTYPVASHGLGSGCSPALPPGCTQELHWTGTVKIEDECAKRVCIGGKTKEEAEKSAGEYAKEVKRQHFNHKANCTGWALELSKKEPGGTAFCAAMGAKWTYESVQEQHYGRSPRTPQTPAWATVPSPTRRTSSTSPRCATSRRPPTCCSRATSRPRASAGR